MGKRIGLIVAILIAVFAAFIVMQMTGSKTPPPAPNQGIVAEPTQSRNVETVDVYVAAGYIPVGTKIEENMLDTQPWPKHLVVEGFVTGSDQAEQIINTVSRSEFQEGEPFISSKLANPSDPNFIAGALPKGMRLVTMPTDVVTGLAGFVYPGDRVDVLLTQEVYPPGVTPETPKAKEYITEITEVLISNAKVMAVDIAASVTNDEKKDEKGPDTVSIAVTPEDAQKLVLGNEVGLLTLALRSLEDKDTIEQINLTRRKDLSQGTAADVVDDVKLPSKPVVIIRGIEVEEQEDDNGAPPLF